MAYHLLPIPITVFPILIKPHRIAHLAFSIWALYPDVLRIPKLLCSSKTGKNCLRKPRWVVAVTAATGAVTTKARRGDATGRDSDGSREPAYSILSASRISIYI